MNKLILFLLLIPSLCCAQSCHDRYRKVLDDASIAMHWAPETGDERFHILRVYEAVDIVIGNINDHPKEAEPLACGLPLSRAEALDDTWKAKGYIPTRQQALDRKTQQAIDELKAAIDNIK